MTEYNGILIQNIYYMLSYSYRALQQSAFRDLGSEPFENVEDLFAAILEKGIVTQIKQGLYREYIEDTRTLTTLRGKIDIDGSIREAIKKSHMLVCCFDEFSENVMLNRILKTTASYLLNHQNVSKERKKELRRTMAFLGGVDTIPLQSIPWSKLQYHRNNQTYQLLINICCFTLSRLLLTTGSGSNRLADFLFDDNEFSKLYEKFILEYYRKEYPEYRPCARKIEWNTPEKLAVLPEMKSDILLKDGLNTMIIDAKFYSHTMREYYAKRSLISENLYQIFTYVKNEDTFNTGRVSGLLLYAKTDEECLPDVYTEICGNHIGAGTLDLNRPFSEIRQQLNYIVARWQAESKEKSCNPVSTECE